MTFGELKEQAIKDFFDAWRRIQSYDMAVFNAENYEEISLGDVIVDKKGAR